MRSAPQSAAACPRRAPSAAAFGWLFLLAAATSPTAAFGRTEATLGPRASGELATPPDDAGGGEGELTALFDRWEAALLVDRPREVVEEGRARVAPGGDLAGTPRAVALVARALLRADGPARARELLGAADVPSDRSGLLELELARIDLAEDRLEDASRRLVAPPGSLAPVRHPELVEAWLLLGRARFRAGARDEAEPLLAEFLRRAPFHPEASAAWNMRAQIALRSRDLERAREFRDRAQALARWQGYLVARTIQAREHPDAALPRLGLAELWAAAGDLDRAERAVREALDRDPGLARAWALAGDIARRDGRAAEARERYGRALDLDPALHEVRWNLALLLEAAGEEDRARAELERLCASGAADRPPLLEARLRLARCLLRGGESEAARTEYARYRALGGENPLEPPR